MRKSRRRTKKFKSEIKEIVIGSKKSEEQKSEMNNIKAIYESRKKVIKLFDDYSRTISEAMYRTKHGEGLKILTSKQMLQRFPIALAQVKAGNTSETLLNEIRIIYSLYRIKEITKNVHNNKMHYIEI